jgi:hypothetical protein
VVASVHRGILMKRFASGYIGAVAITFVQAANAQIHINPIDIGPIHVDPNPSHWVPDVPNLPDPFRKGCKLGDPPSCWTGISNKDVEKGIRFLSGTQSAKGGNSLTAGPGERQPQIKITDKDIKTFWDFYYPQVIQPTGRFINREAISMTDSVGDVAEKVREGKTIDAIWELSISPLRNTDANAGKLIQESPTLDTVGQVAAGAFGPPGAAAYASWSTYHKTGDANLAFKAGVIAGASTAIVNKYSAPSETTSTASASATTSSASTASTTTAAAPSGLWNPALARKSIEGAAIIGMFAAAAGDNGQDAAREALKGGAAIYFNGTLDSHSAQNGATVKTTAANRNTITVNGQWTISWNASKPLPGKLFPIVVNYIGGDARLTSLSAKSFAPEPTVCTVPDKQNVVAKISVDFPAKPSPWACEVTYQSERDTTHPWQAQHNKDYCADKAFGLMARLMGSGMVCLTI